MPRCLRAKTELGALIAGELLLAVAVLVEFLTLLTRVLIAARGSDNGIPSYLVQASVAHAQFQRALSAVSPAMMLIMLFSWVPILSVWRRLPVSSSFRSANLPRTRTRFEWIASISFLIIAVFVGAFVALSPYNRHQGLLGIDTAIYYRQLESLETFDNVTSFFSSDWHPLYVAILYLIKIGTGWATYQVIVTGPAVLVAFFALGNFAVVRELTDSILASGAASLFAVTWLHTTVGLFAGIFANWLAMGFALLSFFCLLKTFRNGTALHSTAAVFLAYMTALSHVWTWAVLVALYWLGSSLLALRFRRGSPRLDGKVLKRLTVILILITLPAAILILLFPQLNQALFSPGPTVYGIAETMRFERIGQAWFLMSFTLREYVGGLMSYPLAIAAGLLGVVFVTKSGLRASAFLIATLIVTSVTTVLLDSWYQWRVIYVIPFEILAGAGVAGILAKLDRVIDSTRSNALRSSLLVSGLKTLFVVLLILDSVNYAMTAVENLPSS